MMMKNDPLPPASPKDIKFNFRLIDMWSTVIDDKTVHVQEYQDQDYPFVRMTKDSIGRTCLYITTRPVYWGDYEYIRTYDVLRHRVWQILNYE